MMCCKESALTMEAIKEINNSLKDDKVGLLINRDMSTEKESEASKEMINQSERNP